MRILVIALIAAVLSGCHGQPVSHAFMSACYGGDYAEHLAGLHPAYSGKLTIIDSARPALLEVLHRLAKAHELKLFNDGAKYPGSGLFIVYLCSKNGAFIEVDSRTKGDNTIGIDVFAYEKSWNPSTFVSDMKQQMSNTWPGKLRVDQESFTTLR